MFHSSVNVDPPVSSKMAGWKMDHWNQQFSFHKTSIQFGDFHVWLPEGNPYAPAIIWQAPLSLAIGHADRPWLDANYGAGMLT